MDKQKIGAIVQARLSSTRLPNKVLMLLVGKPVLWHVLNRLQYCKKLDAIILATTTEKEDKKLKETADSLNIPTFFGSLSNVLSRYYYAAKKYNLDFVVRITADCPVIDPGIVDEVIERAVKGKYDYYGLDGQFPDGLDVTIYSFKALETAFKQAVLPSDKEHVGGTFFKNNKNRFKTGGYKKFKDKAGYRWTLDEPADYKFLKIVYKELYNKQKLFNHVDIFRLLKRKPGLMKINNQITRNEGYLKSLKQDAELLNKKGKKS
jgi:spore coat polysaccharide biosynthesis protein SpsF (cytidylyltransferase family)